MTKNTSFSLGEHYVEFIHDQVESGRFGSKSEVIREGLRMLEEREMRRERLRQAIQEGLDSGPPQPFDPDAFLAELKANHKARAEV